MKCDKIGHAMARAICEFRYCPECGEFLAGESPSGIDQPLVGEHAERAENKGQSDSAERPVVGQTKGGVELRQILDDMRMEAAMNREKATKLFDKKKMNRGIDANKLAAVLFRWADKLAAVLDAEPQPQSAAEDVEECPRCFNLRMITSDEPGGDVMNTPCPECSGHGGNDVSGAGLPNAKDQTSP